jgi:hypothetical protein
MNEKEKENSFGRPTLISITHSFQKKFKQFFSHMIHMHAFYPPSSFYDKWSTTSQSKSPKIKKSKLEGFHNTKLKLKM